MLKKILPVVWLVIAIVGLWKGGVLAETARIGKGGGVLASSQINQLVERGVGDFVVIDVRGQEAFDGGHIGGARNLTVDQMDNLSTSFLKNKSYVVTGFDNGDMSDAAKILRDQGLTVFIHQGGMQDWTGSDLPIISENLNLNS